MPYPTPPWMLKGHALLTLHLVDLDRVRALVPSELNLIAVLPGKTLGAVYFSRYESGSVLEYSELIVAPALVSYGGKSGAWVTHIYVDSPDSVAGGQEIWGLPKELAEFTWEPGKPSRIRVTQQGQTLCALEYGRSISLWQQSIAAGSFSAKEKDLLWFKVQASLQPGLVRARFEVPSSSPFAALNLGQPWLTPSAQALSLTVDGPEAIGTRSLAAI
jgi:acetoacetate decarboxylase